MGKITGYCVKCKAKSEMENAKDELTSKGKPIIKGKCVKCGTTMCCIGKKCADFK